ncbi:mechanosensitive ion channel family protein [Pikeienuella piscinae]|uniref:Mechanosensitive ion channel family protein n=1 Tax=Pikeienuella piscinae TaxID=2748098 RepID=A0A7L5BZE3_9RHOB|nr:mechanosensitive ion channel family protein [Pikeienuella piscinae]QIE57102.1 mechanosensitive ion channel family protein [Pikeienuella piscinae]
MAEDSVTIQLPENAGPDLIERLRLAFPDASIDGLPADANAEAASGVPLDNVVARLVEAAPDLPGRIAAWWSGIGGGFTLILTFLICIAIGLAVEYAIHALIAAKKDRSTIGEPFTVRAPRGLRRLIVRLFGIAIFYAASVLAARFIIGDSGGAGPAGSMESARALIMAVVLPRTQYTIVNALIAPGAPARRLMGFTEDEAARVNRATLWVAIALGVVLSMRVIVILASGDGDSGKLALIALTAGSSVITALYFIWIRTPLRALMGRAAGEDPAPSRVARLAIRLFTPFFMLVILLDFLVKMAGLLGALGDASVRASGPTLFIIIMACLAVAGLRVWSAESSERGGAGWGAGAFAIAEGAVILTAAVTLLQSWGLDPFAPAAASGFGKFVPALVEASMVLIIGLSLWRVASILLAPPEAAADGDANEETKAEQTRRDTIMPILRSTALVLIALMTAMTALAALGANIAPLLAGAGVFGLAIGFGAQKLVADIISGMFYLYEDSFRIGEYIETASGKGTVERITLRSIVLRHPRGAVYTIPFSDVGTIQNHSRDWVTMKFSFAVPANTDLEMVRKTVKKVGVALLEDPDVGSKFLEPLKSQGAVGISGKSYTIACKFTTRPGEQFAVRRVIYAALQKALQEKNIDLFAPQLTLASVDPSQTAEPAPAG